MLELPPGYLDNFTKIRAEDIRKGDYILYKTRERAAFNKGFGPSSIKRYPERYGQGYISLVPDEEGVEKFGEDHRNVLGFIGARRKSWSVRKENIIEVYRSNLNPADFRKGRKKKPEDAAPPKKRGRPKKTPQIPPPSPPSPPSPIPQPPSPEPPAKKPRKKAVGSVELGQIEAQKIIQGLPAKRVRKPSKKMA